MAKQKKKRNKTYKGGGAAATRPTITRVSAVKRNKLQLWWLEKKRLARPALIITAVIAVIVLIISELARLFGA